MVFLFNDKLSEAFTVMKTESKIAENTPRHPLKELILEVKNITKEVIEELLLDETSNLILIKIFYLLGLTARNYKSCLENRNKLADSISKHGSETDQKCLLNAVKFALHFIQMA